MPVYAGVCVYACLCVPVCVCLCTPGCACLSVCPRVKIGIGKHPCGRGYEAGQGGQGTASEERDCYACLCVWGWGWVYASVYLCPCVIDNLRPSGQGAGQDAIEVLPSIGYHELDFWDQQAALMPPEKEEKKEEKKEDVKEHDKHNNEGKPAEPERPGRCVFTAMLGEAAHTDPGGGGTQRVPGRQLPLPPPFWAASGQQLVAKGAALRSPRAPKAPDAPWAPKPPKGKFCPLCTPALSLNPTLTLTHTPTLSLLLTLHLTLPLPLPLPLALIKTEYWDRAGGGRNIRYEW